MAEKVKTESSLSIPHINVCFTALCITVFPLGSSPPLQDNDKGTSPDPSWQTHPDTWLRFLHRSFLHRPPEGRKTGYHKPYFIRGPTTQQGGKEKQEAEIRDPFMAWKF